MKEEDRFLTGPETHIPDISTKPCNAFCAVSCGGQEDIGKGDM